MNPEMTKVLTGRKRVNNSIVTELISATNLKKKKTAKGCYQDNRQEI